MFSLQTTRPATTRGKWGTRHVRRRARTEKNVRLCGVRAVLRQESFGHSEEDDEGEGEEPGAAGASAQLLLQVLDHELVVRHVCDQPHERQRVHDRRVLVVDVEGEEAVDEQVGGVLGPLVAVGDTEYAVRGEAKGACTGRDRGGGARVSDEDCEGDDERHAVLLSHDGHSLEELKFGRDHAVRPAGHEERRREWVHAFTRNEGDLRAG